MLMDALQQQRRIRDGIDRGDVQAGRAEEMFFQRLAVRRAVAALAAHRRADDHRDGHLPGVHVGELAGLVDQLIGSERDEIAEHDLDDGAKSGEGEAVAEAGDGCLADRGVADASGKLRAQTLADLEGAAVGILDVFADQTHAFIAGHQRFQPDAQPLLNARQTRHFSKTRGERAGTPHRGRSRCG